MKVTVTDRHITQGCPYTWGCPISLALKESYPKNNFRVNKFFVAIFDEESNFLRRRDTTEQMMNFIERFDSGKPVEPFSFEWEL